MGIKHLYQGYEDGVEIYSDEANEFDEKVRDALAPLFKEIKEQGFSLREAAHLAHNQVSELEAYYGILRSTELYKDKHPRVKFSKENNV